MVVYPIRKLIPAYATVEKQLNYKDEYLDELTVNQTKMLENFKIDILLS